MKFSIVFLILSMFNIVSAKCLDVVDFIYDGNQLNNIEDVINKSFNKDCSNGGYKLLVPTNQSTDMDFNTFEAYKYQVIGLLEITGIDYKMQSSARKFELIRQEVKNIKNNDDKILVEVKKGEMLSKSLMHLGEEEGYNIVWKAKNDYIFSVDTSYHCNKNAFQICIDQIADDLLINNLALSFTIYMKNRTLLVEGK
ncbi:toxin co-regulated pilus biosynthesis Q family protein [Shewanella sp. D64]|uniref:TcpQ domain-containing protein n=1 Tax=unclassified Shewanella TaxID=196818 RepID=UPI0022BA4495|nr:MULTISPECIES: TcpQ domain-containing protein [unclassified Shewanella]MEC4724932.1 toxin co-regulated pilus biosynthesis Q family protein [Shewanella sp. D64]MEC4736275.1 toxin co-regulated pilus biosynthesis Q family protein [Shewanella sp. E94]WBJ97661.1 toxin co-regulated pilus biosynthesis Q family protein [Shewanella sp. MTB7]